MPVRLLRQGVQAKEQTTQLNAGIKLDSNNSSHDWGYTDIVSPVMVAGLLTDIPISELRAITCVQDASGNNRLCVDSSGLAQQNTQQTLININATALNSASTLYNVTAGKTFYILGIMMSVSPSPAQSMLVGITIGATNYFVNSLVLNAGAAGGWAGNSAISMSGGVLLAVSGGTTIKAYISNGNGYNITIWGYEQ